MDAKVILGGRYELQSRLGEGGMATVYMALDRKLDRKVAVKVLHSHMEKNDEIRHRFHQEAKTISSLNHPNILKIYDFSGVSSKKLWIVTEIIHGNSLGEYIQKFTSGSLHSVVAAAIIRETAKALTAAHERGVIHRDIKPENIMITEKGKVKLMDFGISKDLRDHSVTQTGTFMGSPSYMSPEQVVSGDLDMRTDTYSLGVVFYEIITGRLPFSANTTSELTRKIRSGNFVEPKYLRPQIQEELNDLICDCMATSRDERPEEVGFVAQQIEHFLARIGFVESHVELERYFKDRVSFEARLRAVESEQALKQQSHSHSHRRPEHTNFVKTEYIRAKANKARQMDLSGSIPPGRVSRSNMSASTSRARTSGHPQAPMKAPVQAPYDSGHRQTGENNRRPRQNTITRRAYEQEMQKRAARARHQRMKAYKRAIEAKSYRRTEAPTDANALWNGAVAIIVFSVLGFGFYELLKVDSRIKKQQAEQIYQGNQPGSYNPGTRYNPGQSNQPYAGQTPRNPVAQQPAGQVNPNPTLNPQQPLLQRPNQQAGLPRQAIVQPLQPVQPTQKPATGIIPTWRKAPANQNVQTQPGKKVTPPKPNAPSKKPVGGRVNAVATEIKDKPAPAKNVQVDGRLKLRSSPAAKVFVNGSPKGTTVDSTTSSNWIKIKPGKHTIKLVRDGYQDYVQTVQLSSAQNLFLPMIKMQVEKNPTKKAQAPANGNYSLIIETNQLPLIVSIKPLSGKGKRKSVTMRANTKTIDLPKGRYRIESMWQGQLRSRDINLPGPGGSTSLTYFVSH